MTEGAQNFVILARQLAACCNFKNAFEMYLCSFAAHPETMLMYQAEFHKVLTNLNKNLAAAGHRADIFDNFVRAIRLFPDNVTLLYDIGMYLYKYRYYPEALCHFEKALNIDNSYVKIEKSLNSTKRTLFPRNNFRAMNDKIRNDAYRRAIQSCINADTNRVVNIKAGTGLLALYAKECKPLVIAAFEMSNNMAKLVELVLKDNNACDVLIVNKPSEVINQTARSSRTVLLTDQIDSGLIGQHILHDVHHAWANLLYSDGKVIPGGAEYFIVGVKCDDLIKHYQLSPHIKKMLKVPHLNVHKANCFRESYGSENVQLYHNLKYMTKPKPLFKINFNHYYDVFEKLHKQEIYTGVLRALEDGEINAIIGYFNLHLTDDIIVTSDPRCEGRVKAWQQAVFFDALPRQVVKNDKIEIPFMTHGGKLTTVASPCNPITRISQDAMKFLHDTEYMNMIADSLGTVCIYIGQTTALSCIDVVDLCPFPMFGLLMMLNGANSLVCHAISPQDKAFLRAVLNANNIAEHKVTILVDTYWSEEVFKNNKFHIIFSHIIDLTGDVNVKKKQAVEQLVQSHLYENGLSLPRQVTIMGQLVSSKWLMTNNCVIDENVSGYKMAAHVNRYQVTQTFNLDYSLLEYTELSDEFVVSNDFAMKSDVIKVSAACDGDCNAIIIWYKICLFEDRGCTSTKRGDSCVKGMAFMNTSSDRVFVGDEANVLRCVDLDGSFKLVLDIEP